MFTDKQKFELAMALIRKRHNPYGTSIVQKLIYSGIDNKNPDEIPDEIKNEVIHLAKTNSKVSSIKFLREWLISHNWTETGLMFTKGLVEEIIAESGGSFRHH